MSKASEELREYCKDLYKGAPNYMTLMAIADRIDLEMVELPKGADGEPVHLNDTVYDSRGNECHVNSMTLYSNGDDATVRVGDGVCSTAVTTYVLTHKRPDSWERIADELEELSESNRINGSGEVFYRAGELAARIRRLADKEG